MIPATTQTTYISGISALNIPSRDGTGDWHTHAALVMEGKRKLPLLLVGDNQDFSSNDVFGLAGIEDRTDDCDRYGIPHESSPVYAANHIRAIADMVIFYLGKGFDISALPLEDWLNTKAEKLSLFEMLQCASKLSFFEEVQEWITRHSN